MKLLHAVFYTNDIERSKSFYLNLGFELLEDSGKFVTFKTDDEGVTFAINLADKPSKVPGKQTVIFGVFDIQKKYKEILEKKIDIDTELYQAPFGWTFAFKDPDGNKVEYIEMEY